MQVRIPFGDRKMPKQPFQECCSAIQSYRVGRSPLLGSGVIAVLAYVKLVGRTEVNVSLLESLENRPCMGGEEQCKQQTPSITLALMLHLFNTVELMQACTCMTRED